VDLKSFRPEVVAIGISTGGPHALTSMLPGLPDDLNLPILIVQHMPSAFTRSLAEGLDARSALMVKEAVQGETIERNIVYIAPGGRQMKVGLAPDGTRRIIVLTDDPPENNCKPSVDYLFRSVAEHYAGQAIGVIMTGMGSDGTTGLGVMKETGSVVIAQDEASSVVFGMPREAIERGVVDIIAPLDRIATEILRITRR
jgi:two-component system chemotaxis response regulator CheB